MKAGLQNYGALRITLSVALSSLFLSHAAVAQSSSGTGVSVTTARSEPMPGADPFLKQHPRPGTAVSLQGDSSEPALNIRFTVETYTLSQSDAREVSSNPSGSARHSLVLEKAAQGKARFDGLMSSTSKPGTRVKLQQCDELRYPTEFAKPLAAGQAALPTMFETRNTGEQLEYETSLAPDDLLCGATLFFSTTRFLSYQPIQARPQDAPVYRPLFESRSLRTSAQLWTGNRMLLEALNIPHPGLENGQTPPEMQIAFGRTDLIWANPSVDTIQQTGTATRLKVEFSTYSLPLISARDLLNRNPTGFYDAVEKLARQDKAKLEGGSYPRLIMNQGAEGRIDKVTAFRYATGYRVESGTLIPDGFETRNLGGALEIANPVLHSNGIVDIKLTSYYTKHLGNGPAPEAIRPQPMFENSSISTSMSVALGEYALIGTLNPPYHTGVSNEPDRVWLAFVRVTLSNGE